MPNTDGSVSSVISNMVVVFSVVVVVVGQINFDVGRLLMG